ncbi:MAG: hypothetical protein UV73_C0014G0007 [Candidatus Gottesmanbacteria bacterium GW2011_GWA2_43_14]|uniref:Uncharacterized protein n=1 Tax=Candidatus Gottesmanbacteria bacterium GW2011_GWA2_43_14 TaxID=1618443 RepID=A0A0G1DD13_9BACT|nr:MAG: hypothetical protein UV73_C0014G0007 [Candidatus Gottesmanbacteria bacterium GW2011_GWA2_43_14]
MKYRKKLVIATLVTISLLTGYLILAKNINLWPSQKPEGLVRDEQLEKKYGRDYKPIHVYIKVGASEEEILLLKNRLELFPEVVAVEVYPWPKSKSGYSAAVRLIPMVKRNPSGLENYPSNVLEFLDEAKKNPTSPTRIINNWSLRGEPNEFFDLPI